MRIIVVSISLFAFIFTACNRKLPDSDRVYVAEVEGNFLYLDELQQIVPRDYHGVDSVEYAAMYIKKWATDILLYEKAKQNVSQLDEIERLVNEYRKTLIVHQYQQRQVEHLSKEPSEAEKISFYEAYSSQMMLKENIIKGLLLVVPIDAPNLQNVAQWVKKGDTESIEKIEKYSLQNATSCDYFKEMWVPFTEITSKTSFQVSNPVQYLTSNKVVELKDSVNHYFLRIDSVRVVGQTEPYEFAKEKIANILITKYNSELLLNIENRLYEDAVRRNKIKIYDN